MKSFYCFMSSQKMILSVKIAIEKYRTAWRKNMGIITILWEKWVEFRRDFYKITLAAMIAPLMYLIVFGMGIQTTSHGQPYLNFLIPGVVSLTTMNGSFNAIAQNLNVQRLYEKAFDQVMISPTPLWQFIAGQIIGGSLRGLYVANGTGSTSISKDLVVKNSANVEVPTTNMGVSEIASGTVNLSSEAEYVYVNGTLVEESTYSFTISAGQMVQIITQNGNESPYITVLKGV